MILGRGFRRQRRIGRRLGSGCWRLSVHYALSVARKGRGGLGRRQYTWVLCWTDSCTMGLIASSRSLIILIAVRAVLALRLRYSLSCSFENKYSVQNTYV